MSCFIVSKFYRIADVYEANDVLILYTLIYLTICTKIREICVDFTVLCVILVNLYSVCHFSLFLKFYRIVEVNDVLIYLSVVWNFFDVSYCFEFAFIIQVVYDLLPRI